MADQQSLAQAQLHQRVTGVIEHVLPAVPALRRARGTCRVGGGEAVAEALTRVVGAPVPLLGQVPIDIRLRDGDDGAPLVASKTSSRPREQQLSAVLFCLPA